MRRKLGAILGLLAVLAGGLFVVAPASADTAQIQGLPDEVYPTVSVQGLVAKVDYKILRRNNDGQDGCNATDGSPAVITVNVPSGVTATPNSISIDSCDNRSYSVTLTALTYGTYAIPLITLVDSGSNPRTYGVGGDAPATTSTGTYDVAKTDFLFVATDATPPVIAPHDNVTVDAPSAAGAKVVYSAPATSDNFDSPGTASCTPASGSTFALGSTTVTCTATDAAGNAAAPIMFTVTVVAPATVADTAAPVLTLPSSITEEATDPGGATVTYIASSDDGSAVICEPASGSLFPIRPTMVNCSATDGSNTATGSFTVTVQDSTGPVIAAHAGVKAEATSASGALVTYTAPGTSDAVDGAGTATCLPASHSIFALGDTTVTCSAKDAAGNDASPTTFKVIVKDTTAPVIAPHGNETAEATSASGALVSYDAPATSDAVDGAGTASCLPASGSTFALGDTTVTCSAKDAAGNAAIETTFTVKVQDTIAPTLTGASNQTFNAADGNGAVVTYANPTASDVVDPNPTVSCTPESGTQFPLGSTLVKCTAKDASGNTSVVTSFTVSVRLTTRGYFQPVDMSTAAATMYNTVKAGSTVPLKYEVFAGTTELTNTSVVKSLSVKTISCSPTTGEDAIEVLTSGSTVLRYDATGGQFIQNWQTPKTPGACLTATTTLIDGSTIVAHFRLK